MASPAFLPAAADRNEHHQRSSPTRHLVMPKVLRNVSKRIREHFLARLPPVQYSTVGSNKTTA
jgi:hypothetical protein